MSPSKRQVLYDTVDHLLQQIDARAQQGLSEFTVSFGQADIGRNRLDRVTPSIVEQIFRTSVMRSFVSTCQTMDGRLIESTS